MSSDSLQLIRRLLLALIVFGLVGMGTDLLFLEHYEDSTQLIPLGLISLSLVAVVSYLMTGRAGAVRLMQVAMLLSVVGGLVGMGLHFRGNLEFQLDMDPTASAWDLFMKVMHAKAPPTLAPAAMVQLGLLGLVFCYRHPALRPGEGARD